MTTTKIMTGAVPVTETVTMKAPAMMTATGRTDGGADGDDDGDGDDGR
ncbi:MAG: hypothetical protein LBP95_08415 [Deltaproteobacteria bacterium]|jgi:hypothetical protein|nr:hypothetical protein [Deltaproteobacteria bacterium]